MRVFFCLRVRRLKARHAKSLAAHFVENEFSTRTTEISSSGVRTARRVSTHDGVPKEKNVLRKCLCVNSLRQYTTLRRRFTNNGLTGLRGFHPVRLSLFGPDLFALQNKPRHAVLQTDQKALTCPMSERTSLIWEVKSKTRTQFFIFFIRG